MKIYWDQPNFSNLMVLLNISYEYNFLLIIYLIIKIIFFVCPCFWLSLQVVHRMCVSSLSLWGKYLWVISSHIIDSKSEEHCTLIWCILTFFYQNAYLDAPFDYTCTNYPTFIQADEFISMDCNLFEILTYSLGLDLFASISPSEYLTLTLTLFLISILYKNYPHQFFVGITLCCCK